MTIIKYLSVCFCVISISCSAQTLDEPEISAVMYGSYDSLLSVTQAIRKIVEKENNCHPGKVYVQMEIDTSGNVRQPKIVRSLCPAADSIAMIIAKQLKFHPAWQNQTKVKSNKIITIPFQQ
ncbi:energy transducer TonB [Fulvivirga sedimenti]|uniref:Energy transducer TonB n=1 Tax=Fulvivirga sedimenti TaxID=2879465 RepID=A0A9X1HTE1_9BACT|nr:energy transducer TonB [Fulvivirga sedimenti]MCA6075451.1 energy transducer TonB [Fulvivirga sedimenti]MCA6076628.1 energy transducer TonB [Fulvivirga sedimenti]MCA6077756.1 energy transducer TonB [Fulvivirga sedimenti]